MILNPINTIISRHSVPNNQHQLKTDEMHSLALLNTNDYVDFSIDYTNDEASTILDNIKNSFDNIDLKQLKVWMSL